MATRWDGKTHPLAHGSWNAALYVDALFGAGLSRPLDGEAKRFADWSDKYRASVVAIDVPSGVHGDTGAGSTPIRFTPRSRSPSSARSPRMC